jgi:hypothetical protein
MAPAYSFLRPEWKTFESANARFRVRRGDHPLLGRQRINLTFRKVV